MHGSRIVMARSKSNCKSRRSSNELRLFNQNTTDGYDQPKLISHEGGERMVELGSAVRRFDQFNNLTGYTIREAAPRSEDAPLEHSSCVFSAAEVQAVAGTKFSGGQSHTAGLMEKDKLERMTQTHPLTGKLLPGEDRVECAVEKLKHWTAPVEKTTPDRSVRVYPKG